MQFLPSLHIIFTCSFVFLLAYLLSRVFTFLAHSVIHGSLTSRTRRAEGSSRGRRSESLFKMQQLEQDEDAEYHMRSAVMARLQEEDGEEEEEEEEEKDDDVEVRTTTTQFDIGGGIFDDISYQEYDLKRDDDAKWDDREGIIEGKGLDPKDEERYEARELDYREIIEDGGMKKLEDAEESKEEEGGARNQASALGDALGSSSSQQRLPPTWSDLERMVNMNSKKQSVLPPVSQLPEYE